MAPNLRIGPMEFSEPDLRAWKNGKYALVKDCSRPLKQILRQKACARPGRRFFGEAFVAAHVDHEEGWYGSFKWLTSPRWYGDQELEDRYQAKFRDALHRHFPDLKEFQQVAAASVRELGGRKPVGPDLWLITPDITGSSKSSFQATELGDINWWDWPKSQTFLRSDRPVSAEIVNLHRGEKPAGSEELGRQFGAICSRLKRRL